MAMITSRVYTDSEANKPYNPQDFLGKISKHNGSSIQVDPETCVVSMAPNQLKDGEWVLMFKYKSKTGRNLTASETLPSYQTALAQLSMIIKSFQQAVTQKHRAFNSCVERVNSYRIHYLALSQDKLKKRYQAYMLKMLAKGIPPAALAKIIEQKLHILIHSPINTNKVPYADYLGLMGATATEEPPPSTFERRQRDTNPYSADGPNRDRIRTESNSSLYGSDYLGVSPQVRDIVNSLPVQYIVDEPRRGRPTPEGAAPLLGTDLVGVPVQLTDEVDAARLTFSPPLIPLYSPADRVERSDSAIRYYWSHNTLPPQPPVPESEEE